MANLRHQTFLDDSCLATSKSLPKEKLFGVLSVPGSCVLQIQILTYHDLCMGGETVEEVNYIVSFQSQKGTDLCMY